MALVTPRNYMIYSPLLPQVAAGCCPRWRWTMPLRRTLRRTALVPGAVIGLDLDTSRVVRTITGDAHKTLDLLVLTPGNVTRTFNIPGLNVTCQCWPRAVYLHDHVLARVVPPPPPGDRASNGARSSVVGGGCKTYETAAALHLASMRSLRRYPHLRPEHVRWTVVDAAPQIMPELGADWDRRP